LLRKRLSAKDGGVLPEAAIGSLTLSCGRRSDRRSLHLALHVAEGLSLVRSRCTCCRSLANAEMTSVGTPEIRRFIADRQSEERDDAGKITTRAAKPAEINRELAALRRSFNLAVQAGRLITRPHDPMLKERNMRRGFLDRDQIDRICAALEATETATNAKQRASELANVVRFAFVTGWRTTSEVLPLEWRHVDWHGRCVRLDAHTTKNDEGRVFPFTVDLEKILSAQLAIHDQLKMAGTICPFMFHRNGERIGYFRTAWKNACKAAGCPGALVHDMRRSAVRTFERAGVPRSVAMSLVGHKTESIYRRYAIVDEAMQRERRLVSTPSLLRRRRPATRSARLRRSRRRLPRSGGEQAQSGVVGRPLPAARDREVANRGWIHTDTAPNRASS
jgi:integrase